MVKTEEVLDILHNITRTFANRGPMLNEHYLHHYFTYLLQQKFPLMDLSNPDSSLQLHPEWPTYKKIGGITYRKYKKHDTKNIYLPDPTGGPGFIDFTIGDYHKPDIGIEFSLKHEWVNEEIVYDFMKMMDGKLPFIMGISLNVILRGKWLPSGKNVERLRKKMDGALEEAVRRLDGDVCGEDRGLYFTVIEISEVGERRQWRLDRNSRNFHINLV